MKERRRYQRFGCSQDRQFKLIQRQRLFGAIKDFSRGGLSFLCKERLKKNQQLSLNLELEGLERNVPAGVQVVWSKPRSGKYAYGAQFTNILPEDKFEIMDLLYRDWKSTLSADSLLR